MEPYDRLRLLLRLERKNGQPFERAWTTATARVATDQANPSAWLEVLAWSKDSWRRAYEDKPRTAIDWLEPIGESAQAGATSPLPSGERATVLA